MALMLEVGQQYGKFQVLQVLRKYPHAWVYRVSTPEHDQPVALKLSLDPVQSEQMARRALREVAVLETLTNAHVAAVHGSGLMPDEHWYIVLEHLPGSQLNHWHNFDRALPAADAVGFVHQACLGLAEVHAQGIVHRDLRPERLWVMPDGTVKLLDFSSARSWGEGATGDNVTMGVLTAGSPEYAAPEQAFSSQLSPAADVYSLGVMLYEMLTGRSPVYPELRWSEARAQNTDDPGAWMRAHARTKPTPLSEHEAGTQLPAKLVELVGRALAKKPEKRPASAAELANELGWVLHHELGAAQAAILKIQHGEQRPRYSLVIPGSHRLGVGADADVQLPAGDDGVVAVIEWAGAPKLAELAAAAGSITVGDGEPQPRVSLAPSTVFEIGELKLELSYPKGSPSP